MMITPASSKQVSFIADLLAKRVVPADLTAVDASKLNSKEASLLITRMLAQPYAPKPVAAAVAPASLEGLPKSRYALETDVLRLALKSLVIDTNDTLFVEVREFKGRTYMRRLVGAPGDFLRYRLTREDEKIIADAIRVNPLEAAQRFGERFSICGKCGAPLTDEESRRLSLGPICKKAFGL